VADGPVQWTRRRARIIGARHVGLERDDLMVPVRAALELGMDNARQDEQPFLVEHAPRRCLSDRHGRRRDDPVLACEVGELFHGVELSVAQERGVIVVDEMRRLACVAVLSLRRSCSDV